ncbi:dihydroorotase [Hydrogenispora ethanolica]|uniref:Dihydroorotase n=1 Tax=Hydrogenispora ethanolica TaxID=1082276 RepID=A0A4R1RZT8_HYDET|nr:amidohydrolase/deacetylase family metallohydrolase [Hydrogenispora ethanolica]TCL72375.1 dihydroorotase [Hydrogenispora ethanolica]
MIVKVIDPAGNKVFPAELVKTEQGYDLKPVNEDVRQTEIPYLSPGWIDFHTHVYHGVTSLGVNPDAIGINRGVHLLIDAGSAGAETVEGFIRYVAPCYKTKIKAFLNISTIGLTTMREYADIRNIDPDKTAAAIERYRDFLCGVKVRSSGIIVEDKGLLPFKNAIRAAEKAGVPIMVHMGETPPANADNLALFRKGDILSHCFHGKNEPLFGPDGAPIPEMAQAMERGIVLDVAHGAASMDRNVARQVLRRGYRDFIISTDLHIRNVNGPVYSLAHTMTKFLALGMDLPEVIAAVTFRPAQALGIKDWCRLDHPIRRATLFRVRDRKPEDPILMDAMKNVIDAEKAIEPTGLIYEGELVTLPALQES